jgi:hypothetical protein
MYEHSRYSLPFIDKTSSSSSSASLTSINKLYRNIISILNSLEKSLSLLALSSRDTFGNNIISIETSFATLSTLLEETEHEIDTTIQIDNDSNSNSNQHIDKVKSFILEMSSKFDIVSDKFTKECRRYKAYIKKEKELNNKLYTNNNYAHAIMLTSECLSDEEINDNEKKVNKKKSYEKEIQNIQNFISYMKKTFSKMCKQLQMVINYNNNNDGLSSCLTQCNTGSNVSEDSKWNCYGGISGNNSVMNYSSRKDVVSGLDKMNEERFSFVDFMCGVAVIATVLFVFFVIYRAI